jgi:hypothetical protein
VVLNASASFTPGAGAFLASVSCTHDQPVEIRILPTNQSRTGTLDGDSWQAGTISQTKDRAELRPTDVREEGFPKIMRKILPNHAKILIPNR